jgi:response regulator of citrate/malate metabolism
MSPATELRVLVVDDEPVVAAAHAQFVKKVRGCELVGTAATVREAVRAIVRDRVDLVLLDLNLPDGHGLDIIRAVRSSGRPVDIMTITAAREVDLVRSALSLGVVGYLLKPFSFNDLRDRLNAYLQYRTNLGTTDTASQAHVDAMLRTLHRPATTGATPPKGLSRDLLEAVITAIHGPQVWTRPARLGNGCPGRHVTGNRPPLPGAPGRDGDGGQGATARRHRSTRGHLPLGVVASDPVRERKELKLVLGAPGQAWLGTCQPVDMNSTPTMSMDRSGSARGRDVLSNPLINRGTAFSHRQRDQLGVTGLLPSGISTIETQLARVYEQYRRAPSALAKNVYLSGLRDRNEVLFDRLVTDHIEEMMPIIYTPTIGEAIERYSDEYNRSRGVFLSINHPDLMEQSLLNYRRDPSSIDLIVVTDSEGILGIGDQGVGGVQIAIGSSLSTPQLLASTPAGWYRSCSTPGRTTSRCSTTRCTSGSGMPGFAASAMTSSSRASSAP